MDNIRENFTVGDETALLVNVILPNADLDARESLEELKGLAEAAGGCVVGHFTQKRRRIHPACYVGTGAAELIAQRAQQYEAKTVIFDNDLSPAQIRELEKIIHLKILDRSELILDIFASRAQTHQARLQVELAQLQYTYPRLVRMWSHLDTIGGGGIGTRGPGEKQLEVDRRLVQKRLSLLKTQLDDIHKRKIRQVKARGEHYKVSLVGYTNAGKSTLMNLLTGSETFVKDQVFATLDTKTSRWELGQNQKVLLSDTVGFIRNLPHHLVASFKATLEEAIHADLLLHVVDVSHPQAELQLLAAKKVLKDIEADKNDTIVIFNKIDKVTDQSHLNTLKTLHPDALCVSATNGTSISELVQAVLDRLTGRNIHLRVTCGFADGKIHNFLRAHGTILSEEYSESHLIMEAQLGRNQLPQLKSLNPETCVVVKRP